MKRIASHRTPPLVTEAVGCLRGWVGWMQGIDPLFMGGWQGVGIGVDLG